MKKMIAVGCVHDEWKSYKNVIMNLIQNTKPEFLLIAGDSTNTGKRNFDKFEDFKDTLEVFAKYLKVVVTAGNHDIDVRKSDFEGMKNVYFLENETVEIDGIRFWGGALSVAYNLPVLAERWDYMTVNPDYEKAYFENIPDNVDVVISHSPPSGILGKMYNGQEIGSRQLRKQIEERISPEFVVSSHVHENSGMVDVINKVPCYNVAALPRLLLYGGNRNNVVNYS